MRQIPSPNFGGSRGAVIWIIVHTAEGALTVDSLGGYFASPAAQVSSHVGIDDREIVQYVDYGHTAWTALAANPYADQAELCGFASWTRATWLTHPGMLENTAQWIADRCRARGIPAVKIAGPGVAARTPGVCGHIDITNGLGGTHTDPGPAFPWDVVMARVQAVLAGSPTPTPGGFLMALSDAEQAELLNDVRNLAGFLFTGGSSTNLAASGALPTGVAASSLFGRVADIQLALTRALPVLIADAQKTQDPSAVAAAVLGVLPADFAHQVVAEMGKQLGQAANTAPAATT